jgi:hypothetical protein
MQYRYKYPECSVFSEYTEKSLNNVSEIDTVS